MPGQDSPGSELLEGLLLVLGAEAAGGAEEADAGGDGLGASDGAEEAGGGAADGSAEEGGHCDGGMEGATRDEN